MLNCAILIGRLTGNPELRYTPNGVAVANFTIAVDRPFTNQQGQRETDFIPIVVWRRQAETVANHLTKGRLVGVQGRLQVRSYETAEGQRRRVSEIIADTVRFLDWPAKTTAPDAGYPEPGGEPDPAGQPDDVPF